jgi:putative ABC transport system permease protein
MYHHMSTLLRKSVADVTRRKGRASIAVLGILISVCLFTLTSVGNATLVTAFATTLNRARVPDITCTVQALDPSLIPLIAALPNVETVQVQNEATLPWHLANNQGTVLLQITGYPDPAHTAFYSFQLTSGHYPGPGEIALDASAEQVQRLAPGSLITLPAAAGQSVQLRVAGTAFTRGLSASANPRGYMSSSTLRQLIGADEPNSLAIKVKDETQASQTVRALIALLQARHVQQINASLNAYAQQEQAVLIPPLFVAAALLLASLVIIMTMNTMILEQTRMIGIMKALGGTQGTIVCGYLITAALYACLGTLGGLVLGLLGGNALTALLARQLTAAPGVPLLMGPLVVTPISVVMSLALGLLLPLLAALWPLWLGTRVSVHAALNTYGIAGSQRNTPAHGVRWVGRVPLGGVPQVIQLGLRNPFRRRSRTSLTLLALVVFSVAFFALLAPLSSLSQRLADAYASYHYDFQLYTHQPQPFPPFKAQLLTEQPNIEDVERGNASGVITQWGPVALQEIEADTQVYRPHLVAGRWFRPGEQQVVLLNDTAASVTGLGVGDRVSFTDVSRFGGHGDSASWPIIGIVHDDSDLATGFGVVITTPESYNRFFQLPDGIEQGTLFLKLHDASPQAIQALTQWVNRTFNRASFTTAAYSAQAYHQSMQVQGAATLQRAQVQLLGEAFPVALVGGLVVLLSALSSIADRRREIGIMRALGARGWQVACLFWIEGLVLVVSSWIMGWILSIPVSRLVLTQFASTGPISLAFNPGGLLETLLVLLITMTLATSIPVYVANRLPVARALRYE